MAHQYTQLKSRPDPLQNWRWEASIPGIPDQYIESIRFPFSAFELISLTRNGRKYHFAGEEKQNPTTVELYEDSKVTVGLFLQTWKRQIKNEEGLYKFSSEYKKDVRVRLLDDKMNVITEGVLLGCVPVDFGGYDLKSGSSERVIVTIELSVDSYRFG